MSNPKYPLDNAWRALFTDLGVSAQDVLRHARLPLDLLSHKTPMLTASEYFSLWHGLAHALRENPAFPLQMAQAISVAAFSPPLFASLCSDDLNMALARIAHYKPLVGPLRLDVVQTEQYTQVAFSGLPDNDPVPSSMIAFELAFWVHVARMATHERIEPLAVYTNIDIPAADAYTDYFGVAVQPGDFSGLRFSAVDARRPFLTANDAMWSIFEPELRKRMDDLKPESPFTERVRACLIEILASGQYSSKSVANRLAVSPRTLQRRLKDEGTSFQKILDDLREELALHYLRNSDYTTGQIAFLLGYEEPNSFFRAFRGWTGLTPDVARSGQEPH